MLIINANPRKVDRLDAYGFAGGYLLPRSGGDGYGGAWWRSCKCPLLCV